MRLTKALTKALNFVKTFPEEALLEQPKGEGPRFSTYIEHKDRQYQVLHQPPQ